MGKYPDASNPMGNWREFYGYNVDPYAGSSVKHTGGAADGQSVDVIRPDQGDFGFGGGDLRRAFKAGHSAHSIMKYLKGDSLTGQGAFYDQGGTAIGQEAINDLRAQLQIEQGMKNMFHSYKDLSSKFSTLSDDFGTVKTTQGEQQTAIEQNKALAEQVKINNPSTVTGGSALQIHGAGGAVTGGEGSSLGQLGAGIAGTKDDKRLTTTNLNV